MPVDTLLYSGTIAFCEVSAVIWVVRLAFTSVFECAFIPKTAFGLASCRGLISSLTVPPSSITFSLAVIARRGGEAFAAFPFRFLVPIILPRRLGTCVVAFASAFTFAAFAVTVVSGFTLTLAFMFQVVGILTTTWLPHTRARSCSTPLIANSAA